MANLNSFFQHKWETKKISDIFFFQEGPGVRKWQFRDKGIKLLNGRNINNSKLNLSNTSIYIDEEEANIKYQHFLVNEGDLVIASSGVVVNNFHNKIAFVKKEHLPLCMNTSTIRFQTLDDKISSLAFLKFFLKTIFFKAQMKRLITGSAQLNFGPSHLHKIRIPLPSLNEQIRIATILSKAENLIAKRKESIELLDELLKSTFLEMFGFTNSKYKDWKTEPLLLNTDIVSGVTKGKKYNDKNLIEAPYMRVANVQDGYFDLNEIKTIAVSQKEYEKHLLLKGDILLTEGGDPDKLGRGSVWENKIPNCIHQNHIFRVRIKSLLELNPYFLSALIGSMYGKKYFLKAAKQTTGIASINSTQLKKFPLILPPVDLQNKFAQIVEKVDSIKSKYKQSLTELENLYGTLSQRAFKGELDLSKIPIKQEPKPIAGTADITLPSMETEGAITDQKLFSNQELLKIKQQTRTLMMK